LKNGLRHFAAEFKRNERREDKMPGFAADFGKTLLRDSPKQ